MQASKLSRLPAQPFCLSLHIRHPWLDPAQISRELGCEPDEAFAAGEPRKPRGGAAGSGVHAETHWAATLDPVFWRWPGHPRSAEPQGGHAVAEPAWTACDPGNPLPADRPARFKLLIARGRAQGYLTDAQLKEHLPDVADDAGQLEEVSKTLAELHIPVHAQGSKALATLRRFTAGAGSDLYEHVARNLVLHLRNPALHLSGVLNLVCFRLAREHATFLERVRSEGGSVRLLVTLTSRGVHGLSIVPELSARLAQLGIRLELAMGSPAGRSRHSDA